MIYLLDTDHVSELQRATLSSRRLAERLRQIAPDDYGTTIITFEEQIRGRLAQIAATGTGIGFPIVTLYGLLNATIRFYQNIAIWQYTEAAAQQFEALRNTGIRIGTQDMKIACIALVAEATLLTRNTKDFTKVPNLVLDDWTA